MKGAKRAPETIRAILERTCSAMGKKEVYEFAAVLGHWEEMVGPALAAVSAPERLSGKTLYLEVAEPVWADSMGYMKKEIMAKVNRLLGRDAVGRIKMTVQKRTRDVDAQPPGPVLEAALPASAVAEAEETVKHISDSQLRSTFKRIILKDISRKYSRGNIKNKP